MDPEEITREHAAFSAGHPTLRRDYLSALGNVAQTLGTLAPAGVLGVVIPLLIGMSGNGTWLMFLAVLGVCLLILVNINAFATRCASAGGLYTYARLGLGPRAGAATGWLYLGAMLFGVAGCAPAAAYYACLVISRCTGAADSVALQAAVTALVVLASWWTAFRDIKLSGNVTIVSEVASVAVMIAIVALAMRGGGRWVDRPQLTLQGVGAPQFRAGLVLAFIAMGGFESATTLGDEARQARRSIPRAIMACVVPVGFLYLAMTYLLVGLGRRFGIALDQIDAPFDALARAIHLPLLGTASSAGIALSYFACTLGSMNAGARTLYSLSEDGLFFGRFGHAHPANATPHRAIALLGAFGVIAPVALLLSGVSLVSCIDMIAQLSALGYIGSYFMVCVAAPFFLAGRGALRWDGVAASVGAILLLAIVLVQSVYPTPLGPARYLPYVFLATVGAGLAVSWRIKGRAAATTSGTGCAP